MFRNCVTIMLNPALDVTLYCPSLELGKENRAEEERVDAGGKAVNVSRVLKSAGVDSTVLLLAGEDNAGQYIDKLKKEGLHVISILEKGAVRENISIKLPDGSITRVLRKGFTVSSKTVKTLKSAIKEHCSPETCCIIAGSLPPGIDETTLEDICKAVKDTGSMLGLDIRKISKGTLSRIAPYVIKPNHEEFEELVGKKLSSLDEMKAEALRMTDKSTSHVLLSLGEQGMIYTSGAVAYYAKVPNIVPRSTVGAGDSSLAGFLLAVMKGCAPEDALRHAASYGTSACLTEGTNPPAVGDVEKIYEDILVSQLS